MNGPVVLDTSVLVKWFRQKEVGAGDALEYRAAYLDGRVSIVVPTLVAYELANVLCFKKGLGTDQVVQAVESLLSMELDWVAPTMGLMKQAVLIARRCEVTVYDAVFVALAQAIEAPLITADDTLARRVGDEVTICLLRGEPHSSQG